MVISHKICIKTLKAILCKIFVHKKSFQKSLKSKSAYFVHDDMRRKDVQLFACTTVFGKSWLSVSLLSGTHGRDHEKVASDHPSKNVVSCINLEFRVRKMSWAEFGNDDREFTDP